MTVFETAQKYYPAFWSIERLKTLEQAGKLTQDEYTQIVAGHIEGTGSRGFGPQRENGRNCKDDHT